jgi:integrase
MVRQLQAMGYSEVTVHGFRSSFRDWAGETSNASNEVMEAALAHKIKSKTERAYARGSLLVKRARLMEQWADYCHRTPPVVLPMRKSA